MGLAPTSIDRVHRAPASGLDPTMRCTCNVASTAVRSAGAMVMVRTWLREEEADSYPTHD